MSRERETSKDAVDDVVQSEPLAVDHIAQLSEEHQPIDRPVWETL
jgi:hypothetical protein